MATTHTTQEVPQSTTVAADVFLDVEDLATRYDICRSKAYELVKTPGFPRSVVPGMARIPLLALQSYELSYSLDAPAGNALPALSPLTPAPARRAGRPAKAVA